MKFQKLLAFEKNFKEALSHHLSAVYVVVSSQESERKKILSSLAGLLKSRSDFARSAEMDKVLEHVRSGSLFSPFVTGLFDGVDQLSKGELETLVSYMYSPNEKGCLLLGASRNKEINDLYKVGKSDMVVLDLTKEKPWEEKERLMHWARQSIAFEKKQIAGDALAHLMERLPPDRILIQNELDKLLCFLGESQEICLEDVRAVCSEASETNPYQFARLLIWENAKASAPYTDVSVLLQLVGALRSQLEIGLKMAAFLKRGASLSQIEEAFPRLYPKSLKQCLDGTKRKGEGYFLAGLKALFELELGIKSSQSNPSVLFARFENAISD